MSQGLYTYSNTITIYTVYIGQSLPVTVVDVLASSVQSAIQNAIIKVKCKN